MKKIILPGLLAGLLILIVNTGLNMVPYFSALYNNVIFRPWSDPLMSLMFLYPFVLGLVLAWAWNRIKLLIHGLYLYRALNFGFLIWVISSIPGMLISYSSFNISAIVIVLWTVTGLINTIICGLVFAKLNR